MVSITAVSQHSSLGHWHEEEMVAHGGQEKMVEAALGSHLA